MKLIQTEQDQQMILSGVQGPRGPQGAPGVQQIYDQATAPAPAPGYILLWFQSGVSADPDDREINLVVSP